jgi:aspartate aminotransferase-like enzyme
MGDQNKLFTPGPTEIPPEVMSELSRPMIHHRTAEFESVFGETREQLKAIYQTQQEIIVLASSGTGGMEAAVSNFFSSGDQVLVIEAGKFGERWAQIARQYGLRVVSLFYDPGIPANPDDVIRVLKEHPAVKGVFMTASETSTATYHPVDKLAEAVRAQSQALVVVDAVTAIGIHDIKTDDWDLDVVVGGSQKGFMLPPGLSFVSVSQRAWKEAQTSTLPKYYFDLRKELKNHRENTTAYTPAVSLIRGCHKSCQLILQNGLQAWTRRHQIMTQAVHAGAKAMGLSLLAENSPSHCLTAIWIPEAVGAKKIIGLLDTQHHMTVAGGQDELKDKIIRIAHFGALTFTDISAVIFALEMSIHMLGGKIELGAGPKAVSQVFAKALNT